MRIFYHLSKYISHRLSGEDYIACLRLAGHQVSADPAELALADVAIVHDDPLVFPELFAAHPRLKSIRTIGYCVWENELLAEQYKAPLRLPDEIWTPSAFSRDSMAPHVKKVSVLPHVVRTVDSTHEEYAFARQVLAAEPADCHFFSIVDAVNPRKNLTGLLAAFAALRKQAGVSAALVLKQYRCTFDLQGMPGVTSLGGDLSPGQMAALHRCCTAYVSAHHAEGWGLGLSEAMAYGKPVIATGYSGNMEYMDAGNSVPLPYDLVPVSDAMCRRVPLFSRDMRWADVRLPALVDAMRKVALGRVPGDLPKKAAAITRRFGPRAVAGMMETLLAG